MIIISCGFLWFFLGIILRDTDGIIIRYSNLGNPNQISEGFVRWEHHRFVNTWENLQHAVCWITRGE